MVLIIQLTSLKSMTDCYNNFLNKYPDLLIHLSIISERLKESGSNFSLIDWSDEIYKYFQYQKLDDETEIQLKNLNEELNQAINLTYIFKYKL